MICKHKYTKQLQVLLYTTNNSIKQQSFVYTQLNDQTVLFLTIWFSMSFVCIQFKCQTVLTVVTDRVLSMGQRPIDRTLLVITTPGQSEPGSDGNEGVLHISKAPALLEPHHQIV